MAMMTVVRAFSSGPTPPLADWDHIMRGRVWKPGPVVNAVFMKSSNERVNAMRAAAMIPGMERGKVILRKVWTSLAPRVREASSSHLSKPASLALTTT